ncbi:MAG: pyridoxal-phosphate dependent enzyme [Candidatus Marsarchaeota archaeon]|jgi:threonine synthase|nr:pyridoxal-phosphate dependent enzyme [Candidatus Marsarchaeota archaeon]MCL5115270.1 pyridoxal-phosphate dependent enzyme [Candidatus Marsarchaeota archaeon]
MDYYLECVKCGCRFPSSYNKQTCGRCSSILEVIYKGNAKVPPSRNFWDYEKLMPKGKYKHYQVGSTKMIKSKRHSNLFLKVELTNPTKSFKDRGSVIEIAKAMEYGYNEIAVASTGNMAYSLAYYAKKEGIAVSVFIGRVANPDKLADILRMHDAKLHMVKGDFTKAQAYAAKYASTSGAFLSGDYCYRKEGQKTVGYEIAAQLPDATHIIVPVGNATLISGIYKALKDLRRCGTIKRMPKLVAVQAKGCAPLVKAFNSSSTVKYEAPKTSADAIAVGFPTFGDQAIEALHGTAGMAMMVTEKEMIREQKNIYEDHGMVVELASSATVAAFNKLALKKSDKVAAIISGGNV